MAPKYNIILIVLLQFIWIQDGTAQFRCYNTSASCRTADISMAPTADAPYQCCINYNGLSFQSSSNAEGCTICIVFAFFDNTGITNSLSINEGLYSGFEVTFQNVKGSLSNPLVFEFKSSDLKYTPSPATSGPVFNAANFKIQVVVKIENDNMTLKNNETFQLTANPSSSASNMFTVPLTVTVIDCNILNIEFTSNMYMAYKGVDKYVTLQLARFQAIAQSLVLIVTPMTVDQFQGRQGKTAPTLNFSGNYADQMDFINTAQLVNFTVNGSHEAVSVQIEIVDDGIIEMDEYFVCLVQLADPAFSTAVKIGTPFTTVKIISNEVLDIHFTGGLFSSREEDKYAVIQLRRTQAIGQYIELRVSPLTIEEATKRNISLSYDADLIDSIAWASDGATQKDFINTPQYVNFTTNGSSETVSIEITILDDEYIEAEELFICIVELVDTSLASIVNISSPYTVVIIIDQSTLQGRLTTNNIAIVLVTIFLGILLIGGLSLLIVCSLRWKLAKKDCNQLNTNACNDIHVEKEKN